MSEWRDFWIGTLCLALSVNIVIADIYAVRILQGMGG